MTNGMQEYIVEPLDRRHDRAAFLSGVEPLDRYLHTQAMQDTRRRVSSIFVMVPVGETLVIGYHTLSATAIAFTGLPGDVTRKLPRYPLVPATLIGRLAVDQHYRGRHLGERLLLDAFARSLRSEIASALVVVDAKDETAQRFYEHYGFRLLREQRNRMFLSMATVADLLAR